MDFLLYIFLLLVCGCFGGLMAGFLGVGGGIILTPMQYYLLEAMGVDSSIALTVSFATSLGVIFVTMLTSTRQHLKNNNVVTDYLKYIMVTGFVGALFGAFLSTHLDVSILKYMFAILCLFSALNLFLKKETAEDSTINSNKMAHLVLGLVAGLLCGLLGVGGGVIMIPALIILLHYPVHKAVGTSSASIITTSLGGLISYIILGWNVPNLPAFSIGYFNLVQFVFLTITSSIVAFYAAKLSKSVDERILKAFHIIILLFIGLKMCGFF